MPSLGCHANSHQGRAERALEEHCEVMRACLQDLCQPIYAAASLISSALQRGKKVLLFGNGGSAADAQHLAAEFVGRYALERRSLPALALSTDTSVLTAVGNDYGLSEIFARQVAALAQEGDIVIGISTSGRSENVLRGIQEAKRRGATTIALTGKGGGRLAELVDLPLSIPSTSTPRIQEATITIGHILCEIVEVALQEGVEE